MAKERGLYWVIGAKTGPFQKAMKGVNKELNAISRSFTAAGRTMTTAITLPIAAVGTAIIKTGMDFEKAMTASTAIMGDLSDEMRTKMEKAALDVSKTTRFSAAQAAESYFFLASAGMDAAQSLEALPRVAKFAQAGNFDMALATDLLTDAQSALGMTIRDDVVKNMENMNRVSDVLVKANVLANATVQQFSESLTNKAGAALRLLNKDVEEGVAVLATFADQGLKGAAAGESLNIVMRDLQRASINNRKEFDKHNVSVYDQSGNMRNMADIIGDLEGALRGMSDEQVRTTLMSMGFQERSVSATMALLGTSEAIRTYEKELRAAGGTTEDVAKKQLNNLSDALGLMKDRLAAAGIEIYGTLKPTIENVVMPLFDRAIDKVTGMAAAFTALSPAQQENILKWIAIAGAGGPALMFFGAVAGGLRNIINLFTLLTGKIVTFIGWISGPKFGAAMLAGAKAMGPLVLAAGAVYAAFKVWDAWQAQKQGIFMEASPAYTRLLGTGYEADLPHDYVAPPDYIHPDAQIETLRRERLRDTDLPIPMMAEGGIVRKPTLALIGEAGPEAVVPLGKGVGGPDIHVHFHGHVTSRDFAREIAVDVANVITSNLRLGGIMP